MERSVLQGLAALRWAAWAWIAVVLVLSRSRLRSPLAATALIGVALLVTVAATIVWRSNPRLLRRPAAIVAELIAGLALVVGDGVVRREGALFETGQSIGSVWPLVGVLSAGVAFGPLAGAAAGAVLGFGRVAATTLNGVDEYTSAEVLSLASSVFLYLLAGAVAGHLYRLLCEAREEVAEARAREEVARTLHDGVLQTLALVERRAGDPALARLAREQERDLRMFLFGDRRAGDADLGSSLRRAAARFEDAYGGRAQVLVAEDTPAMAPEVVRACAAAVGEALTNAGRHGGAQTVTVYVEPFDGGGVFCSVKDDGAGFDPATTPPRVGIASSIRGRIEDVGGRVEIVGAPGRGAEVRLWLP